MKVGSVVVSLSGHDMGDWFLVTKIEGEYAFMCDGKNRSLEKPKKKNIKHLYLTNEFSAEFADMINSGQKIQNAFVRKTLKFFKEQ